MKEIIEIKKQINAVVYNHRQLFDSFRERSARYDALGALSDKMKLDVLAARYEALRWCIDGDFWDKEIKPYDIGMGVCKEDGCQEDAQVDYNGHGYFVCHAHNDSLNRFFEDNYQ